MPDEVPSPSVEMQQAKLKKAELREKAIKEYQSIHDHAKRKKFFHANREHLPYSELNHH